ncbi:hypothetical protein PFISCL1PPCAC_3312, partial [Pristionchus fissidentatus]
LWLHGSCLGADILRAGRCLRHCCGVARHLCDGRASARSNDAVRYPSHHGRHYRHLRAGGSHGPEGQGETGERGLRSQQGIRASRSRSNVRTVRTRFRIRCGHCGRRGSERNWAAAAAIRRHDSHPHLRRGARPLRNDCRSHSLLLN